MLGQLAHLALANGQREVALELAEQAKRWASFSQNVQMMNLACDVYRMAVEGQAAND